MRIFALFAQILIISFNLNDWKRLHKCEILSISLSLLFHWNCGSHSNALRLPAEGFGASTHGNHLSCNEHFSMNENALNSIIWDLFANTCWLNTRSRTEKLVKNSLCTKFGLPNQFISRVTRIPYVVINVIGTVQMCEIIISTAVWKCWGKRLHLFNFCDWFCTYRSVHQSIIVNWLWIWLKSQFNDINEFQLIV